MVRPVRDTILRQQVLQQTESTRTTINAFNEPDESFEANAPLAADRKLLLECVTPDPGQPRANAWLWFKNGQPIDPKSLLQANNVNPSENNVRDSTLSHDNTMDSSTIQAQTNRLAQRRDHGSLANEAISSVQHENEESDSTSISGSNSSDREMELKEEKMKLLSSGRYLYIPSIQLAHKGNYSCVAMNRFGAGPQRQQQSSPSDDRMERDSFNLNVALAPSFVRALPPRIYWSEISSSAASGAKPPTPSSAPSSLASGDGQIIMELVCHVQCDPICNIEWLRNGQPIDDMKSKWQEQEASLNYVGHQIRQSILDENLEANLFKSIESKLVLKLQHQPNAATDQSAEMFTRERVLARRNYLNGSNFTCQSTPNSVGPAVKSTSKFVVQCK